MFLLKISLGMFKHDMVIMLLFYTYNINWYNMRFKVIFSSLRNEKFWIFLKITAPSLNLYDPGEDKMRLSYGSRSLNILNPRKPQRASTAAGKSPQSEPSL